MTHQHGGSPAEELDCDPSRGRGRARKNGCR
jgi:hypothetical protein